MTCKSVDKYDGNDNFIASFPSLQDCMNLDNVSSYIIRNHNNKGNLHNGVYYVINKLQPYYTKAICDYCGKEFDCQRFRTEDGREHLFCSKKCEGAFRKSQTELNCICEVCGKQYHASKSHIEKYGSKYCSKECHNKAKENYMKGERNHQYGLKGDKNTSWKSDERISYYGYKLIRILNHPFRNCDDFVFEHRLVAERYLLNDDNSVMVNGNRYLSPDFVAHHIDFNRLNNVVENLTVMLKSEHSSLHKKLRRSNKALLEYCNKYNLDIDEVKKNMKNSIKYKPKR